MKIVGNSSINWAEFQEQHVGNPTWLTFRALLWISVGGNKAIMKNSILQLCKWRFPLKKADRFKKSSCLRLLSDPYLNEKPFNITKISTVKILLVYTVYSKILVGNLDDIWQGQCDRSIFHKYIHLNQWHFCIPIGVDFWSFQISKNWHMWDTTGFANLTCHFSLSLPSLQEMLSY